MIEAPDFLALQARLQPRRLAARDLTTGASWTYAEFDNLAARCAALMQTKGVGAGDRVALCAKNRAEIVALHAACARIGAIFVPLNWRLAPAEVEALVAHCEPRLVVGDRLAADHALDARAIDDFLAEAHTAEPIERRPIDRRRPSLILYTSGTSGRPKGVVLGEDAIDATAANFSLLARVTHASAFLCDTPMFHVIGIVATVRSALMRGAAILISDGFVVARTLARLGDPQLGVTHYFCVPQMAAMLRADPAFDPRRLSGLTGVFTGGAPHPRAAILAWLADGIAIADGFGMSEAGTVTCMPLELDLIAEHAGACGIAPPSVRLRIVDEQEKDVPPGTPGELLIKGASVMRGYWRRPEETAAAFAPDGWLRSGDVARLDAEGYLWLVDRKKDMFISGGENVYPAEIEAALSGHPDIAEAAAFGVPDARWGEVGHLALAPRSGRAIDAAAIRAYLRERLAHYKTPHYISVVDALPRSDAGKVLRRRLREIFAASRVEDVQNG
jgi:fatty-acyl-CoA synthase